MKRLITALFMLAIPLGIFGYWGTSTQAGRHAYDEMDGIIPELAFVAAALIFLVALILVIVQLTKIYLRAKR